MTHRMMLVVLLCGALLHAQPASAQTAPPRAISFSGQIIEASNPAAPAAPGASISPALLNDLKKTFQFTQYKSLGTVTDSTPIGKTWTTPLAGTGLTMEATPKAVNGGITVEVRLLRGGGAVVTTTLRLAPGGQVLVGGPTTPSGRLILALTGR